jgi:hypothetical protein
MAISVIEWIGTGLQVIGAIWAIWLALNLSTSRMAYPIMLFGSILWAIAGIETHNLALLTLNAVFASINVIGIWRWFR